MQAAVVTFWVAVFMYGAIAALVFWIGLKLKLPAGWLYALPAIAAYVASNISGASTPVRLAGVSVGIVLLIAYWVERRRSK